MKYIYLTLVILFGAAAAHAECVCPAPAPSQAGTTGEAMAGEKLTAQEARNLELTLATHPDDVSARTKLLGYYSLRQYQSPRAAEARKKHILWIIGNRPDLKIVDTPFCEISAQLDKPGYEQGKKLWLKLTQSHPQTPLILGHAAQFFFLDDQPLAEKLLQQAKAADADNPEWPDRLGRLYMLQGGKDRAAQALGEYERAQAIEKSEFSRFVRLDGLAKAAFDAGETEKASRYAHDLLNESEKHKANWNYGNAIHQGNNVLGRVALKQGDVKLAGEYLLKAGATPGSPQLDSFGPNMALAKELLEKGEKNTVLRYFELCRKFWDMGGAELDAWTQRVQDNQMPDFGANLVY